ncbi:hypothetical protein [Novosphingobium sp. PC22D]|uniref:hypothetical protein n=1 Tax=Novosphingobium sp. PC22D TaxID=1962403 RepID=UPI001F0A6321|nr:hypothetical protein [Novosphingobium sp. PC22D]
MARLVLRPIAALVPALALSACASNGNYPSLALRDAERISGTARPAAPTATPAPELPPASADLLTRINDLLATARKAHAVFENKRGSTNRAVGAARGASSASDSWVSAQVALADLQAARSPVVTVLAELDGLYVDARDAAPATVSPSAQAIVDARDSVDALVAEENSTIEALGRQLRS